MVVWMRVLVPATTPGMAIFMIATVTVTVIGAEVAKSFQVTGDATFTLSNSNVTGAINGVPGITLFMNVPLGAVGSVRGVVTGSQIVKNGPGALALASASPTLPPLNVAVGSVQLGANQSIGSLSGAAGTTIALGASTLTVNQTAVGDFAGTITGAGNLIKNGPARLTLSNANTYTGTTTVNAGILRTAMPLQMDLAARAILGPIVVNGGTLAPIGQRQFADAAPLTLTAPGTMDLTQAQDTFVGSLAGTGDISLGPSGLTVGFTRTFNPADRQSKSTGILTAIERTTERKASRAKRFFADRAQAITAVEVERESPSRTKSGHIWCGFWCGHHIAGNEDPVRY